MDSIDKILKEATMLRKRSRSLLLFAAVTAGMGLQPVQAQTFAEWFRQNSTQKKYLYQQIAALQIYSSYLKDGYKIAKGGLGSIGNYVGREFRTHDNYYKYLRTASSAVRNDPQVLVIMRRQTDILNALDKIKVQQGLNDDERSYLGKVRSAVIDDCDARLTDLQTIMEAEKTTISDEDRLRHLGRIYQAMQDNYRFAERFLNELRIYVRRRGSEKQEFKTLNQLYANH